MVVVWSERPLLRLSQPGIIRTMDQNLCRQVDAEIEAGRLWKARDLLQEDIQEAGAFDGPQWARLGEIMLAMGDTCEAGCWLFFSGERRPEYEEAIGVFLAEHPPDQPAFLSLLPAQIIVETFGLGDFPPAVVEELKALGFCEGKATWGDRILSIIAPVGCLTVIAIFVIGIGTVARWVLSLF